MKTITIITPSSIEVEYRLAGAGSRVAAFLIDFAVQVALIAAAAVLVLLWADRFIMGNTDPSGTALGIVMVFAFLVQFGYFIVWELMTNGQSLGKRIFGLRVIRDNGQPLGFSQSLVRGLIRASLDMLYVGLIVVLFSKKHKRLGDMAAGTVVICENSAPAPVVASAWPSGLPDAFLLTAEERQLVEDWLARRDDFNDGGGAIFEKIKIHLQKYNQPEEDYFESISD
ncbi:MAG: RDD family protein [Defluviitaleaceae bacterium]|nr:RDD family protein [Defluviitaleaceae bacterium]